MGVPFLSTPYEFNPDRALFGKVIKRWFATYDLPQVATEHWAKANGSAGPWASQMSQCQAGKIDPKPAFFVSLGHFNKAIADSELGPINDRRTLDRLKAAEPLCHDDGTVYAASDFFNLFCGLIKPPAKYYKAAEEEISDELVAEINDAVVEGFKDACREQMLSSKEIWPVLLKKIRERHPAFSSSEEKWLLDVVLGIQVMSKEAFTSLVTKYKECPVLMALAQLCNQPEPGGQIFELLRRTKIA